MFIIGNRTYNSSSPLLMGILNITPDSFYDGGRYIDSEKAVEHALKMVEEGADFIDIGGESSRPGSEPVSEEEEISRVIPVVEALVQKIPVPVSVDTYKANVALRAAGAGADIINDVSALRFDPGMADVIKETGCSVILMHMLGKPQTMQDAPQYENVVEDILAFLKERVTFAAGQGIPEDKIIVDPGIGFGKTLEHNMLILKDIARFHETGCPVMIGASRKSMIGRITGAPVEERLWGTAAVTAFGVFNGIEIHRVHDVKAMRQVCDVAAAIQAGAS